ncbi:MAG: hypothetical protein F4128_10495 [Gammaproteobacteria bacterium]|nr:hypothetical protein [Gammaproteobacteria bacterium]
MSMQYLVFFSTAALCLVLIWKTVTGKISYDSSFGAGLGLLIAGMAVQFVFPEYLFLVPLAMIFMMLVSAVWAFDAGSAPVARFVDACLALPFLGACLTRVGIRVLRYFNGDPEEDGL